MTYTSCHSLGMLFFCLDLCAGVKFLMFFDVQAGVVDLYADRLIREYIWYTILLCGLQATIGIDFLSKTMYLEDRTVSTFLACNSISHIFVNECACYILR